MTMSFSGCLVVPLLALREFQNFHPAWLMYDSIQFIFNGSSTERSGSEELSNSRNQYQLGDDKAPHCLVDSSCNTYQPEWVGIRMGSGGVSLWGQFRGQLMVQGWVRVRGRLGEDQGRINRSLAEGAECLHEESV